MVNSLSQLCVKTLHLWTFERFNGTDKEYLTDFVFAQYGIAPSNLHPDQVNSPIYAMHQ